MRNYGQKRNCGGCRFWSEMIAQSIGCGPIQALCLADGGPRRGKYTSGRDTCEAWKSGHHGAIDSPPHYGEEVRKLYDEEDEEPAF